MLAKENMSGKIFGQKQNLPFSNFANMFELGGISSYHDLTNELNGLGDWRNDPRITCFRDLVRKRIAGICELEANYQCKERGSNLINFLENQLFMEAASQEEYMNLDVLRQRLRKLIQREMVGRNCNPQMPSYTAPTCEVIPTLGLAHGYNSDAAYFPPNHLNYNISEYNSMVVDRNQFGFLRGLFDNQDSHMRQISYDMLLSPERSSVITTSSEKGSTVTASSNGDGFSEVGAFDGQSCFSKQDYQRSVEVASKDSFQQQYLTQGVANKVNLPARAFPSTFNEGSEFSNSILQILEHDPQVISEDSVFPTMGFSRMNSAPDNLMQHEAHVLEQKLWQPYFSYEQFNKPFLQDEALCYSAQQSEFCSSIAGQTVSMHSQPPSEQLRDIHVASESSSLVSSSKEIASPNYGSFEYKILCAYSSHKSSVISTGDCLVSFVNYLHSTLCKDRSCMCKHFCSLLSHFDKCCYANCDVCGPVRDNLFTHKHHLYFENLNDSLFRDSSKAHTGGYRSCSSENTLPPAKRLKPMSYCSENSLPLSSNLKMEKSCLLLSSDKRTSNLAALMVQPSDPEGLPPLLQWPESPVSINSEVLEGNIESSTKPMQSPSFNKKGNNVGEKISRLNAENLCRPSIELIVTPTSKEIDSRSCGEIVDSINYKPDQLRVNSMPALSEEPGTPSKVDRRQVSSAFDLAKPDLEAHKEEELKSENPRTRGVSLIEFFSADEIKDHISSLRQWVGQGISTEEKEKQETHCANENTCQLCAGDKLLLAPVPIYCSCCGSRIKRSVIYYSTSEENGMRHCFCTLCYKARGANITFYGITMPKAKLEKKKNDEEIEEPWVQCDKCKSWQHQICALFNDKRDMEGNSEYICPKCCLEEIERREHMPLPKSTVLGTKDLPSTLLSDYIEQRLFRRLQQEKVDKAKVIGKNIDEVPGAEDLVVRVVLSVNKQLKVKKQFLEIFRDGDYPDAFAYRSKVILLFQTIEGVDVCLFGMYVQEFGSECSQPNHRCVYISYLDSVKYFRPERETATGEALRTFVYHEILVGYLEYCKKQGFVACYLWACPPLKGEDYILYSHPSIQKTPKSDKLRQWYHSMIRKASKENVVVNVTNLYDHFFVPSGQFYSKVTATRLPYFDGDYWSGAAETIINNIEQQNGKSSARKVKKSMTKRTLKAMGHTNPSDDITKEVILMQKLGQIISPVKEDFLFSICNSSAHPAMK